MKNRFAAVVGVAVLFSACTWAQSGSVADAAQQGQQKKARHVIDDDNLSSAVANGGDVQNASATDPAAAADANDTKDDQAPTGIVRDKKADTPKGEVERQKAKENKWIDTIEICKQKLAAAETDTQREVWTENLASAEDGLSKTRKDLANAEQELQNSEQNQPSQPAAPAGEAGNPPEQTGSTPQ